MSEEWRNELVTKGAVVDALTEVESHYGFEDGHDHLMSWAKTKIFALPSAQPEYTSNEEKILTMLFKVGKCIVDSQDGIIDFDGTSFDLTDLHSLSIKLGIDY